MLVWIDDRCFNEECDFKSIKDIAGMVRYYCDGGSYGAWPERYRNVEFFGNIDFAHDKLPQNYSIVDKSSRETLIRCIDGCVVTDHDDLNIYDDADALYGGGWRSTDKEELKKEYGLSDSDAEKICEVMEKLEEEDHGKEE